MQNERPAHPSSSLSSLNFRAISLRTTSKRTEPTAISRKRRKPRCNTKYNHREGRRDKSSYIFATMLRYRATYGSQVSRRTEKTRLKNEHRVFSFLRFCRAKRLSCLADLNPTINSVRMLIILVYASPTLTVSFRRREGGREGAKKMRLALPVVVVVSV